jgi:hypothetical protein
MASLNKSCIYLLLILILYSCKKEEDSSGSSSTIEYRITPMSNAITRITYNNGQGTAVVVTNLLEFSAGSKVITTTMKPFTAKLTTETINTTNATITFNLSIIVDNQLKNQITASIPPIANAVVNSVEYVIQ